MLACVVFSPVSLIQELNGSAPLGGWELEWWLSVANAIATTLLLVWLGIRAIQVLLGRPWRASVVTARLAGGVLAVVAANHLWLAAQIGFGWQGAWSINISPQGTRLIGFPGWQIWHLVMLVAALMLLAGPRRMLRAAARVLMLLFAGMVPLVLVAAVRTGFFELALLLLVLGMTLIPVYLWWWLSNELGDMELAEPAEA